MKTTKQKYKVVSLRFTAKGHKQMQAWAKGWGYPSIPAAIRGFLAAKEMPLPK